MNQQQQRDILLIDHELLNELRPIISTVVAEFQYLIKKHPATSLQVIYPRKINKVTDNFQSLKADPELQPLNAAKISLLVSWLLFAAVAWRRKLSEEMWMKLWIFLLASPALSAANSLKFFRKSEKNVGHEFALIVFLCSDTKYNENLSAQRALIDFQTRAVRLCISTTPSLKIVVGGDIENLWPLHWSTILHVISAAASECNLIAAKFRATMMIFTSWVIP